MPKPRTWRGFALLSCSVYSAMPDVKLGFERFVADEMIRPFACVDEASGAVVFWNLTRIPYRAPPVAVVNERVPVVPDAPPAAVFFFLTRVPFSTGATRGFEPEAFDGAADVGAIGAGFLVESFFIFVSFGRRYLQGYDVFSEL